MPGFRRRTELPGGEMTAARIVPYGAWTSLLSAERVATAGIDLRYGLGQPVLDGGDVYWAEGRPSEGGRTAIVRCTGNGVLADLLAAPWSARSRVHEYGGGDFMVAGGIVFFTNQEDQRLYRLEPGGRPQPLTPAGARRHADPVVDERRRRIICVCEDHGDREPANTLVAIDLDRERAPQTLCAGNDFYAWPRLSPDGRNLAWLAWDHPHMPWDASELWTATVSPDGTLADRRRVAGGNGESICQPEWSPDGVLHFVSDASGWWNLQRWCNGTVEPLCPMAAEFGVPLWSLGTTTYAFLSAERIVCAYAQEGGWSLACLDTRSKRLAPVATPYTEIGKIRAAADRVVFCGGAPTEPLSMVQLDLATRRHTVLRRSAALAMDAGDVSVPEPIGFPTSENEKAYAFFYPPANRQFCAPPGEVPPLLVTSHGGPTGAASTCLDLKIQYWTSRGFAVVDVNYRGSTGYGRAYRRRLDGVWGVLDVEDCVRAAQYLAATQRADAGRLLIHGSSAAGYTTLCALTFHPIFRAGASYYGVSDLEALAADTHKFESHYLERLVGPYPQRRDVYRRRSPIHFADRLSCPVILFQGLDDRVVPPSQSQRLADALRAKRLPVAYLTFPGEQHGFRRAATVRRALEAELYFYSRVLGFALAEPVEPVEIENL
jgi:dipeptidyl aminopeptidase/acylaminoacyl peptidase